MKTNIEVIRHEDKTAKTGMDYTRFEIVYTTDEGTIKKWASCFDKDIIDDCKKAESDKEVITVDVERSKDGQFTNIRALKNGKVAEVKPKEASSWKETVSIVSNEGTVLKIPTNNKTYEKDPVGMAIEIYNARDKKERNEYKREMVIAIELVKQAQEGFK